MNFKNLFKARYYAMVRKGGFSEEVMLEVRKEGTNHTKIREENANRGDNS